MSSAAVSANKISTSMRARVKKMAIADIIKEVGASIVRPVSDEVVQYATHEEYTAFVPPKTADTTPKEMFDRLIALRKDGVPVVDAGPSLTLPYDVKSTWSWTQPNILHKPDKTAFNRLVNSGISSLVKAALEMKNMVRSNGTRTAVLSRLSQKLAAMPRKPLKPRPAIEKLNKILIVDVPKAQKLGCYIKKIALDSYPLSNLNPKADAGLPYAFIVGPNQATPKVNGTTMLKLEYCDVRLDKGVRKSITLGSEMTVCEHAIYWSEKIWTSVLDAPDLATMKVAMVRLLETHPELATFIMKRKDEKIEREDHMKKVRPYGVQALAMRLIGMCAYSPLENGLISFFENPDSCSAYHYSPFYGGGFRILSYLEHHVRKSKAQKKRVYFHGICYGDDQFWLFIYPEKKVMFICGPDISSQDMSTLGNCVPTILKWAKQFYPSEYRSQYHALAMTVQLAFRHYLHLGGPYTVTKSNSLISGIPGTTIVNIGNSAQVITTITEVVEKTTLTEPEQFPALLKESLSEVTQTYAYTFKDVAEVAGGVSIPNMEMVTFEFDEEDNLNYSFEQNGKLNVTFLGLQLTLIPQPSNAAEIAVAMLPPNIPALAAGLVLPGNGSKPSDHFLDRLRGVYVSGGWADPQIAEHLEKMFMESVASYPKRIRAELETEITLDSDLDMHDVYLISDEQLEALRKVMRRLGIKFPTRQLMFDANVLRADEFEEKYTVAADPIPEEAALEAPKTSLIANLDEIEDDFSSKAFDLKGPVDDHFPIRNAGKGTALSANQAALRNKRQNERVNLSKVRDLVLQKVSRRRMHGKMYHPGHSFEDEEDAFTNVAPDEEEKRIDDQIKMLYDTLESDAARGKYDRLLSEEYYDHVRDDSELTPDENENEHEEEDEPAAAVDDPFEINDEGNISKGKNNKLQKFYESSSSSSSSSSGDFKISKNFVKRR